MKKKKLKKRILQLESERNRLAPNEDVWKDMFLRFIEELGNHEAKAEIVFPEPPMIEVESKDGVSMEYIPGITTEPPTIKFDFSKHDSELREHFEKI